MSSMANETSGGSPLAEVVLDLSQDGGNTWVTVLTDTHPSSPSDTENASYTFASAGSATLRATVSDASGLAASATQAVAIAKASQGSVSISPVSETITAGQSIAFAALGGDTGNYSWGGAARGTGAAQTVEFPTAGSYMVTVDDSGNSNYNPSPPATATITVQAPFNVLTLTSTGGGSVAGGGSYPPGAEATALATADPGNAFAGWTGDATGTSPSLSVLMSSNVSLVAHFSQLLTQTISYVPPGSVSTRSPAFALSVTSTSGLPVLLVLNSGPATLASNVITPSGTQGQVVLTATQPGNSQYLAAQPVVITFAIGPPPPGVLLSDDSAATKRSDKATRVTSFTSAQGH